MDGSLGGVLWRGYIQVVLCWTSGWVTSRGYSGSGVLGVSVVKVPL